MSPLNMYNSGGTMVSSVALLKLGLIGSVAVVTVGSVEAIVPANWSVYINVFLMGWGGHGACCAYVGGMTPPTAESSNGYRHWYKTCHLFMKVSSAWKVTRQEEAK